MGFITCRPQYADNVAEVFVEAADFTANEAVSISEGNGGGGNNSAVGPHNGLRSFNRNTRATHAIVEVLPVVFVVIAVLRVEHLVIAVLLQTQIHIGNFLLNHRWATHQNRVSDFFIDNGLYGAQHVIIFTFSINDTGRIFASLLNYRLHK